MNDTQGSLPKAIIIGLVPGSSAEKSGAKKGDIVLSFNGETISNMDDYLNALNKKEKGKDYDMEVLRGNSVITLHIVSSPWNFNKLDSGDYND